MMDTLVLHDRRGEMASWMWPGTAHLYWAGVLSAVLLDLQRTSSNFWLDYCAAYGAPFGAENRDLTHMTEIDRDSDITIRDSEISINVGFGNISFCRDESGPVAKTIVDIADAAKPADRIEMTIAVPADPHLSIMDVVEKSRLHIIAMLQAALDRLEAESAETLLYR